MHRDILPNRPLKLSKRYRNNRLVLMGLVAMFPLVFLGLAVKTAVIDLRALDREQAVWEHGKTCATGSWDLTYGSDDDYVAAYACQDEAGALHTGSGKIYGLTLSSRTRLHGGEDSELRFDPSSPGDFAVSDLIALIDARRDVVRGLMITMFALFGVIGVFAALIGRRLLRASRIARSGDEGVVHIVKVKPVMRRKQQTHARHVYWKIDATRKKTFKSYMDAKQGLAWINSHEPRALALLSKDRKHAILLTGTLEPLRFDDWDDTVERKQMMARLEAEGGGQARGLAEMADWIVYAPPAPAKPAPRLLASDVAVTEQPSIPPAGDPGTPS